VKGPAADRPEACPTVRGGHAPTRGRGRGAATRCRAWLPGRGDTGCCSGELPRLGGVEFGVLGRRPLAPRYRRLN